MCEVLNNILGNLNNACLWQCLWWEDVDFAAPWDNHPWGKLSPCLHLQMERGEANGEWDSNSVFSLIYHLPEQAARYHFLSIGKGRDDN